MEICLLYFRLFLYLIVGMFYGAKKWQFTQLSSVKIMTLSVLTSAIWRCPSRSVSEVAETKRSKWKITFRYFRHRIRYGLKCLRNICLGKTDQRLLTKVAVPSPPEVQVLRFSPNKISHEEPKQKLWVWERYLATKVNGRGQENYIGWVTKRLLSIRWKEFRSANTRMPWPIYLGQISTSANCLVCQK